MIFEDPDEDEQDFLFDNWKPESVISVCAMCNSQSDHILLATLAYKIALITEGLVCLGDISNLPGAEHVLKLHGRYVIPEFGYFVTPSFICNYMSYGTFRLVK